MRAELQKLGEVVVVTPATEQSAAGHSVTISAPLVVQEVLDEVRNVLGAIAQRRQVDLHDVEPVEEVLAEAARLDLDLQVAVRGADDPHVEGARAV